MIVVDTSAWVEYLRATGSEVDNRLDELIRSRAPLAVTDTTYLEIVAGARDAEHASRLTRLLERAQPLPTRPFFDHEAAASLYAWCRRAGTTPRTLLDCLIAAVAIRCEAPILHNDRDFDRIAEHSDLAIA